MRVLALDIGEKRVGVAVSSDDASMAFPLCVLASNEVFPPSSKFKRTIEDYEVDLLLCGLPLTMAGEEGPQAKRIRAQAEELARTLNLPLEFADERLSSSEAKEALYAQGLDAKKQRGKIDMIAASLFLRAWLESREN